MTMQTPRDDGPPSDGSAPPEGAAATTGGAGLSTTGQDALFPPLAPFDGGWLAVGDGHRVYYEQCGTPDGPAAVFLHGGPGSGCSPRHRRLLDPRWRIVLFDQRGSGHSTPPGECRANTTAHLVADIERLRRHLGIGRWLVFGGSWGSSLALAYCAQHRDACLGAILRGIFLTGRADIDWFFNGAGQLLPDHWAALAAIAPSDRRERLADWYFETLAGDGDGDGDGDGVRIEALWRWMAWEEALSSPLAPPPAAGIAKHAAAETAAPPPGPGLAPLLAKYRLQAHYLRHECFIGEARALDCARRMAGLPALILHGRLDLVCRPSNAWALHQALPGSRLHFVAGAGHSPFDPPLTHALAQAGRHFLVHGSFAHWQADAAD